MFKWTFDLFVKDRHFFDQFNAYLLKKKSYWPQTFEW